MGEFSYSQESDRDMGERLFLAEHSLAKHPSKGHQPTYRLAYEETYRCPACGSGELSAIAMMDIFACNFCRHMFTANLQTQSVQLADSLQPMAWQWNGQKWRTAQQSDTAAAVIWGFAVTLTVVPVTIIAVANYIFPPLEGSQFPTMWTELTLMSHSLISGWLLAEYHRWPWYISSRIRVQRLKEQLLESS